MGRAPTAAALVALAVACRDPSAPCQSNSECRDDELCVLERCHTVCSSNQQCKRTESCRDGICWPEVANPASDAAVLDSASADRSLLDAEHVDRSSADQRTDSAVAHDAAPADRPHDAAASDTAPGDRRDASAAEAAVDAAQPDSVVVDAAVADSNSGDAGPCTDYALLFDGTDDYFEVPDSSSLDGMSAFTIEAWVYIAGPVDASTRMRIISHHSAGAPPYTGYSLAVYYGPWSLFMGHGASYQSANSANAADWPVPGRWYHVAGSFDGSVASLFVNGKLLATVAGQSVPDDCADPLTVGAGAYDHAYPFSGLIDEVRVSSVARYSADFAPPTAKFVDDSDTAVLWHLDEGSGQMAFDTSAHERDAFLGSDSSADAMDPTWVVTDCIGDRL